jgi:dipeptide transport system ATP-binding protein
MNGNPVVQAENIRRYYGLSRGQFARPLTLRAVDGVSFTLEAGETLAVVGESGCGKSTLARVITMIEPPSEGSLRIDGIDVTSASRATLKDLRRHVQIVFQDPYGSLNPRQKIGAILEEPLKIHFHRMPAARHDGAGRP